MIYYIERVLGGLAVLGLLLWALSIFVPGLIDMLGTNVDALPEFAFKTLVLFVLAKYVIDREDDD